ncbi:unnamed protein product [Moneuplotes crassus]|uniref:DEP domain-containing protein n=1 Tax=Euplotes crassus TaxID=5936 RepID=A0AAD1X786_EUPCR|nr:unnamed protein product [Moneuplotes crassus]
METHSYKLPPKPLSEEDTAKIISLIKSKVEIKDRRYNHQTYKNCFIGRDVVNVLLEFGYGENIHEALQICEGLRTQGVIGHVCEDKEFENRKQFYVFESDRKELDQAKTTWQDVLKEEEGKHLCSEEVKDVLDSLSDWPKRNSEMGELLVDKHNREVLDNCRPLNWTNPSSDVKYDMVAIGGGAGGLVSSITAAVSGAKSAIIERNLMGGDCLNTGCVPSKAFIKAAKVAHTCRNASKFGVMFEGEMKIDFARVMERMREVRAEIAEHDSVYKFAKKYGIDMYLGDAKFLNEGEIDVNGQTLKFEKCSIATGGHPYVPDIEGLSDFPYLTSENVFNITEQPNHLVIIGAGPIGCELGQSFARFGTRVTMLSKTNRFLPKEDPDAAAFLHQSLMDDGVNIVFNAEPTKIQVTKSPGKLWNPEAKFEMEININGISETIKGDSILVAAGRRPNVHGLGLEEAGVEYDHTRGVHVDDYCMTTNKDIYAVGDVCSPYQFTHNSDIMAKNAAKNALFSGREKSSEVIMSWCTYTDPELAHIGKYPSEMDKEGIEYDTYKYDISNNDRAICDGVIGLIKIHCQKDTDKILGGTIVGGPAGDMVSQIAQAMYNKVGLSSMGAVVHPYPTYGEAFKALTSQINGRKLAQGAKTVLKTIKKVKV